MVQYVVIAHVRSHQSCGQPRFDSQKPHHMWVVFAVLFSPLFWEALLWELQLKPPLKKEACEAEGLTPQTPEVRGWSFARRVFFSGN